MRAALSASMAILGLVACRAPEREPSGSRPTAAPTGRHLTDGERAAMLAVLGGEQGAVRKVWFAVPPNDPEAAALKGEIEGVFKQAGWKTESQTVTGMVLKPGLSILIAAEEPPSYVSTAQRALEATAFEFKVGTGYRPYYEERKKADPNWPGIPLGPAQDYVVVIGPRPPAS
jgi:hypothetical protein